MSSKNTLQLRKEISRKRPEFVMQDHHKRPETQKRWRRPKGLHSKMRHGVWGRPACVNVGYRGPAEVRGLDAKGMMPVLINNEAALSAVDPKKHSIIIGSVGDRKRAVLLNACKQKGITVLNFKKIDEELQNISNKIALRKETKKQRAERKQSMAKAAPKKEAKKEEPMTKEQERKEAEKVIIQKEA
ncbi:MAG: eL32 family ribosomal protein [Candidatus Woesearchaeota archaeon]